VLAAFDHGVCAVIVDTFKIFSFDPVPDDIGVGFALDGDSANEILNEDGIIIRAFGDVFLVRAFQKGKDLGASAGFDQGDEVFDPDGF